MRAHFGDAVVDRVVEPARAAVAAARALANAGAMSPDLSENFVALGDDDGDADELLASRARVLDAPWPPELAPRVSHDASFWARVANAVAARARAAQALVDALHAWTDSISDDASIVVTNVLGPGLVPSDVLGQLAALASALESVSVQQRFGFGPPESDDYDTAVARARSAEHAVQWVDNSTLRAHATVKLILALRATKRRVLPPPMFLSRLVVEGADHAFVFVVSARIGASTTRRVNVRATASAPTCVVFRGPRGCGKTRALAATAGTLSPAPGAVVRLVVGDGYADGDDDEFARLGSSPRAYARVVVFAYDDADLDPPAFATALARSGANATSTFRVVLVSVRDRFTVPASLRDARVVDIDLTSRPPSLSG